MTEECQALKEITLGLNPFDAVTSTTALYCQVVPLVLTLTDFKVSSRAYVLSYGN